MDCKKIHEVLADYLGNELDSSCRAAFESHLAICSQCRKEVESLQTTLGHLERLTVSPTSRADGSNTGSPDRRKLGSARRHYAYRLLAYAATLAIGIGIGWFSKSPFSDTGKAIAPLSPKVERHFVSGILQDRVPNQFIRNAAALSAALNQPFGSQGSGTSQAVPAVSPGT